MKPWSVTNKVQIDRLEVLTAEGRARRLHANVIAGIGQAHQDGLNGRHGRKMSQLKRIEKKWGFVSQLQCMSSPWNIQLLTLYRRRLRH
jgi:hypothetical protein